MVQSKTMGLSMFNIKKWHKMMHGKSILHVNQDMGKSFVPGEIKGYFNNLTEKVTKEPELLDNGKLPLLQTEKKGAIEFPVGIFQYGLGTYDLYLQTGEEKYLTKFKQCVDWALAHQFDNGAWDILSFLYPDAPYSAMCQGEGASLLTRAYVQFGDESYLKHAEAALGFMLISVDEGGTSKYDGDDLILLEYTNMPAVLNGWIFASFGLYDVAIARNDGKYKEIFDKTIDTIIKYLPSFDNGYWSKYNLGKNLASPFYHNLHIAQMHGLYLATGKETFKQYENKWGVYRNKWWNRKRAFVKKAWQKIKE
jgi:heparosan-N-sulfate-glucuronate 5-epimerase